MADHLTLFPKFKEADFKDKAKILFIGFLLPFYAFWKWLRDEL